MGADDIERWASPAGPSKAFMQLLQIRRGHYQIGPDSPLPNAEITKIITHCLRHTPSMFNMQSTRVLVLYGEHHRAFWDLVAGSLPKSIMEMRPNVAYQHFAQVKDKIASLRSGVGTVLFFEDQDAIDATKARYPAYSAQYDTWTKQSSAIAQYAIWLAFTDLPTPLGITLQHYNPPLDEVQARWGVSMQWTMTGQMPFGGITGGPIEKELRPDGDLVKVFERSGSQ